MPVVVLTGCPPVPLLSYLKALGLIRIVAEQADADTCGFWRADRFVLDSRLDAREVEAFLLEEYQPSPIMGPWAGGSGFFPKDRRAAVDRLAASRDPRVATLRGTIEAVRAVLEEEGIAEKPKDAEKLRLLRRLRAVLPDEALHWLDAAFVLADERAAAAPLLGSGGNDGRLDFGRSFLERLDELGFASGEVRRSEGLLREALWGTPTSGLRRNAVGQFDPGGAGGPNATAGMEGDALLNPWDWVLGMEGALLFAGAASRRYRSLTEASKAVFPFTVQAVPVGDNVPSEAESARGELWLPLWERPATLAGVRHLFAEGRLTFARQQARDGVESAQAVATLGVQRGVSEFVRFGLYERFGRNYLATVMGRFPVKPQPALGFLQWGAAGRWLEQYRQFAAGTSRHGGALRRLEAAIIDLAQYGGAARVAAVLAALGRCERELAVGMAQAVPGSAVKCPPLPMLDGDWLRHADDGSVEFRVARAVASVGARSEAPLRVNLEPAAVRPGGDAVYWAGRAGPQVIRRSNALALFAGVLERRLLDGGAAALRASAWVGLNDVVEFLNGYIDWQRLLDLVWALSCVSPATGMASAPPTVRRAVLPRDYALLRLALVPPDVGPDRTGDAAEQEAPAAILAAYPAAVAARRIVRLLVSGDLDRAVTAATRRLRADGMPVLPGRDGSGRDRVARFGPAPPPSRLAAALLLPVGRRDLQRLCRLVCRGTANGDLTSEAPGESAPTPVTVPD